MVTQIVLFILFLSYGRSTLGAMNLGYCPEDKDYGPVKRISCNSDSVCKKDERCCQAGEVVKCVRSVNYLASLWNVKKGKCPKYDVLKKLAGTACRADQDCKEKELCCGAKCAKPVSTPPTANSGYCPAHPPVDVVKMLCKQDNDCGTYKKCCQNGTVSQCQNAVFEKGNHSGFCPDFKGNRTLTDAKLCNGDSDCFGKLKCCPASDGMRCQPPENRRPNPKPGHCKEPRERNYLNTQAGCRDDYDCAGNKKCCYKDGIDDCVDV